ncbi:hypothetical protein HAHE_19610 [Haloferula helveola]|uniref:Uncharacterized protein n=1 Tax=Haloferula helveola TaxID=490095 RepID=A0ABM7RDB1_9BACT|nr:hypothetical protein HAHE_19610 [Haloferula helveola]
MNVIRLIFPGLAACGAFLLSLATADEFDPDKLLELERSEKFTLGEDARGADVSVGTMSVESYAVIHGAAEEPRLNSIAIHLVGKHDDRTKVEFEFVKITFFEPGPGKPLRVSYDEKRKFLSVRYPHSYLASILEVLKRQDKRIFAHYRRYERSDSPPHEWFEMTAWGIPPGPAKP